MEMENLKESIFYLIITQFYLLLMSLLYIFVSHLQKHLKPDFKKVLLLPGKEIFKFRFFALAFRLSAALSSATEHAMPPEFDGKWDTEVS